MKTPRRSSANTSARRSGSAGKDSSVQQSGSAGKDTSVQRSGLANKDKSEQQGSSVNRNHMRSRNLSIDILRLFFAVIIVLHHSRYVLGDENSIFLGGSLAVEFYFFVSGYLLLADVEKAGRADGKADRTGRFPADSGIGTETFRFILRKIRSFLPEFLISWVIGFIFVCAAEQYGPKQAAHEFIRDFWELTMVKMSGLFVHGINGVMWYLSAMLLSMAVLYPLLRRHRDVMTHLVCPLLALFFYGYLCRTQNHPRDPVVWLGFLYKGLLRAAAGLCVGIVIRMAVERLQRKAPRGLTGTGAALVALAELFCLVLPVRYMALHKPGEQDYFYMFLLMLLVLLCFSRLGAECLPARRREEQAGFPPLQRSEADAEFLPRQRREADAEILPSHRRKEHVEFLPSRGRTGSAGGFLSPDAPERGPYADTSGSGIRQNADLPSASQTRREGRGKISLFLSRYSLALYLSHLYFAQHINSILPETGCAGVTRLAVYLVFSFANGLLVMALASLWRRKRGRVRASLKKMLVR